MPDEVLISVISIGENSPQPVDEGVGLLSAVEVDKANAYRFRKHRDRYIRGRALLRKKLAEFIDASPQSISIAEEKRGKPFVPDCGVAFNISHSQDLALFAISTSLPRIGADIELLSREPDIDGLSRFCFTADEQGVMRKLSGRRKKEMFFMIWTAKEARMKLTGEGLHLDPRNIDLEFENGLPLGFKSPRPGGQFIHMLDYPDDNAVGSIVADQPFEVRIMR